MYPEKSSLNTLKTVLIIFVLAIIVIAGRVFYTQNQQIVEYQKHEKAVMEESVNYKLTKKLAVDSATKNLNEEISKLQLENMQLKGDYKINQLKLRFITKAYQDCQQELNYSDLPDRELIDDKNNLNLIGKSLTEAKSELRKLGYSTDNIIITRTENNQCIAGTVLYYNIGKNIIDITICIPPVIGDDDDN